MSATIQHKGLCNLLTAIMLAFFILSAACIHAANRDQAEACAWAHTVRQAERCSAAYDDAGRIGVGQLQSEAR